METAAISVQGLRKTFGSFCAVERLTLEVPRNSLYGLLGPNGAGKTTLFSLIAGFLRPDEGQVEVLGINNRRIAELQGRLSILPQDALFQANVPILDQMVFFCRLSGRSPAQAQAEAKEALKMVGLEESMKRSARALSHGMVKRLGIAQAFLGNPEVILLDEPTAGLDPANARKMRDLIRQLQGKATLIVSSHNLREVQEMCTHVAILDKGKLVRDGAVEELTRSSRQVEVKLSRELSAEEIAAATRRLGIRQILRKDFAEYAVSLEIPPGASQDQIVGELLNSWIAAGAVPRQMSEGLALETVFLQLTGEESTPA